MLIMIGILDRRWTMRDASLVPFARSKLLRRLSRVSRCSAAYRPSLSDILQAPFCPEVENRGTGEGPRLKRCVGLLDAFAGVRIRRQHLRRARSMNARPGWRERRPVERLVRQSMFRCKSSPRARASWMRNLDTAILLDGGSLELVAWPGKVGRMHQGACFSLSQNY